MVPVLICLPIFSATRPGSVCFMQNHKLLWILSVILGLLMVIVFLINILDVSKHFSIAYLPLFLFICSTSTFVILGVLGTMFKNSHKANHMVAGAFWIWCTTWFCYLIFCIYSVWNRSLLEKTSINKRCALLLWVADWCYNLELKKLENSHPQRNTRSLTDMGESYNSSGANYRVEVAYYLGIAFWIVFISVLFTLYGYTVNNLHEQMTTQPLIITIAAACQEEESNESTSTAKK